MEIISQPAVMQHLSSVWKCAGHSLGLVPTMGALHEGHLELCRRARAENDRFVASIFVNPTQFAPHEDLAKYPRPFARDRDLLREIGCDAIFAPDVEAMYGASGRSATTIDVGALGEIWEAAARPGHMSGVATVVAKLFNIAAPTRAYFGEKDFQQLRVVEQMTRDLNFDLQIVPVPTLRELDGLALSSRNAYLDAAARAAAPALFAALKSGAHLAANGERDVAAIIAHIEDQLAAQPLLQAQYVAIVDAQTLQPVQTLTDAPARLLAAVCAGPTRLIDNISFP